MYLDRGSFSDSISEERILTNGTLEDVSFDLYGGNSSHPSLVYQRIS